MLPLGIAGLALSLAISLVFLELVGVQLQTLRNKQVADVISLKVSGDLLHDGIAPIVGLEYLPVTQVVFGAAVEHLKIRPSHASVISVDAKTIEATVCSYWRSITGISLGNIGEVCAKSKARAIS